MHSGLPTARHRAAYASRKKLTQGKSGYNANMFAVNPEVADAIRQAFQERGELAAIVELRRHFPLFESNDQARSCVLAIASWKPIPPRLPARVKKPD